LAIANFLIQPSASAALSPASSASTRSFDPFGAKTPMRPTA
jgi:hypothetical protein